METKMIAVLTPNCPGNSKTINPVRTAAVGCLRTTPEER